MSLYVLQKCRFIHVIKQNKNVFFVARENNAMYSNPHNAKEVITSFWKTFSTAKISKNDLFMN